MVTGNVDLSYVRIKKLSIVAYKRVRHSHQASNLALRPSDLVEVAMPDHRYQLVESLWFVPYRLFEAAHEVVGEEIHLHSSLAAEQDLLGSRTLVSKLDPVGLGLDGSRRNYLFVDGHEPGVFDSNPGKSK